MSKKITRIIIDTNVLYAGLFSSQGASFRVLRMIEKDEIKPVISTTLLFEYEEILKRNQSIIIFQALSQIHRLPYCSPLL